jgi:hypothetical protein
MKRFIVIALIAICVISSLKHHRNRRHADTARHESRWSWPDHSLPPRERDAAPSKRSSMRFASARAAAASSEPAATVVSSTAISSDLRYTEDRALADLHSKINQRVGSWLAEAGIPDDWQPPKSLVDGLVQGSPELELVQTDDYSLYRATVPVELTQPRKQRFVQEYHRHLAGQRLGILGGVLAFVLACLGIGVGYVRTDEATKGYYTGRLRLLAAGGVGAAGVLLYQWILRTI